MSILSSTREPSRYTTHQDAATAVGTGTLASSSGQGWAAIDVSGTFNATLKVLGRLDVADTLRDLQVYDAQWEPVPSITQPGRYYAILAGVGQFAVRVDSYTSGSVTAKSRTMSWPVSIPRVPPSTTTLFNAVSSNQSATFVAVRGRQSATFQVSGTFVGTVRVRGFIAGNSHAIPVMNDKNIWISEITKPGLYQVPLRDYEWIGAQYIHTSGACTVVLRVGYGAVPTGFYRPKRFELVASALNVAVAASTTAEIGGITTIPKPLDLSDYALIEAAAYSDAIHTFSVRGVPVSPAATWSGSIYGFHDLLVVGAGGARASQRGVGEWVEPKTPLYRIYVANGDVEERRYDVYIYGVR